MKLIILITYIIAADLLTILIAKYSIKRIKEPTLKIVIDLFVENMKPQISNWWRNKSRLLKIKAVGLGIIFAVTLMPAIIFPALCVLFFTPDSKKKDWVAKIYTSIMNNSKQSQSPVVVKSVTDEPDFEQPM